jgi:hypothetical protein
LGDVVQGKNKKIARRKKGGNVKEKGGNRKEKRIY